MKKKLGDILISLFLLGIGICLLYWAGSVIKTISVVLGSAFILYGLINLYKYIKYEPKSTATLVGAIVLMIAGLIIILRPTIISEIMSFVIGLFIIITCIASLSRSLERKKDGYKLNMWLSIVGIIIGILLILGKILIPNIILQFMGILLIVYGVINIINVLTMKTEILPIEEE